MAKLETLQNVYKNNPAIVEHHNQLRYSDAQVTSALACFEANLLKTFPSNWDTSYASSGMILSPLTKDVFFLPSIPFGTGIITVQDINALLENPDRKILSIGAGPAYFERFLVELGVSVSQILLADKDPRFLPSDIPSIIFDMNGQWPLLNSTQNDSQFDLIVFSQTFPNFMVIPAVERQQKLIGILHSATEALLPNGEMRMSGLTLGYPAPKQEFFEVVPDLNVTYDSQKQFLRATRVK